MLKAVFGGAGSKLKAYHALLAYSQRRGWRLISKLLARRIERSLGVFFPPYHSIPLSTHFPHPTGIVIGEGVELGENVTIYQNVTIGGARQGDWARSAYPSIGDNVVLFAGAVVVGKISLGEGCVVGANSVVVGDVPAFSTVAGAPARIIKKADEMKASRNND